MALFFPITTAQSDGRRSPVFLFTLIGHNWDHDFISAALVGYWVLCYPSSPLLAFLLSSLPIYSPSYLYHSNVLHKIAHPSFPSCITLLLTEAGQEAVTESTCAYANHTAKYRQDKAQLPSQTRVHPLLSHHTSACDARPHARPRATTAVQAMGPPLQRYDWASGTGECTSRAEYNKIGSGL